MQRGYRQFSPWSITHKAHTGGWLYQAEISTYDDDGRLLRQVDRSRSDAMASGKEYGSNRTVRYPAWLLPAINDEARQSTDLSVLTEETILSYQGTGLGYNDAGLVTGYTYSTRTYTHTYKYTYRAGDTYTEQYRWHQHKQGLSRHHHHHRA